MGLSGASLSIATLLWLIARLAAAVLPIDQVILGLRIHWLRTKGRAPLSAPGLGRFFLWGNLGFMLGPQHKEIGDRLTTSLVYVGRAALVMFALSFFSFAFVISLPVTHPAPERPPATSP